MATALEYFATPETRKDTLMKSLVSRVALVTGASRGIGKGIALGLAEAGATVYITGRTVEEGKAAVALPGTIHQTADEVTKLGGKCIAVQCDHRSDQEVESVFRRIRAEQDRLDILVNNVWGGYEHFSNGTEFWKETGFWTVPISRWDAMFQAGVRAHYVVSVLTAPIMIAQHTGLIVNISFFVAQRDDKGVAYSVAKAASDRMAACMAYELREYNVAVVSLYPGLVRTESVMKAAQYFDLSNSESPQFIGRAVAALAADPGIMQKSGKTLVAAALAQEYGFTDVDGKQPRPLTVEEAQRLLTIAYSLTRLALGSRSDIGAGFPIGFPFNACASTRRTAEALGLDGEIGTQTIIKTQHRGENMATFIHQRVEAARAGINPTVICRMPSGWAALCDVQFLRGYSLLFPDPVVPDLNTLDKQKRTEYLLDMTILGDALLEVTGAYRINYEILGNLDPALHAHVIPRYMTEPEEMRKGPPLLYDKDYRNSVKFDYERDKALMNQIAEAVRRRL